MPRVSDPYVDVDRGGEPLSLARRLEIRGASPAQIALRRAYLRFSGIRRGHTVLDVGCGTGVVTRDLARLVGRSGQAVGIDPSAVFIREARRLARQNGLGGNLRFQAADGRKLPVADGRFDASLAVTVLLHAPGKERIVAEMARVVRPGGKVIVVEQDHESTLLDHDDEALTLRIQRAYWDSALVDSRSGRKIPGLLGRAELKRIRILPLVHVETRLDAFLREILENRAHRLAASRVITKRQAHGWLETLERKSAEGTFFYSMNYYCFVGTR